MLRWNEMPNIRIKQISTPKTSLFLPNVLHVRWTTIWLLLSVAFLCFSLSFNFSLYKAVSIILVRNYLGISPFAFPQVTSVFLSVSVWSSLICNNTVILHQSLSWHNKAEISGGHISVYPEGKYSSIMLYWISHFCLALCAELSSVGRDVQLNKWNDFKWWNDDYLFVWNGGRNPIHSNTFTYGGLFDV